MLKREVITQLLASLAKLIDFARAFIKVLLWERERDRMVKQDGVLLDISNAGDEAFRHIVEFANNAQGLLWNSPLRPSDGDVWASGKKLIVVTPGIVKVLTEFINSVV